MCFGLPWRYFLFWAIHTQTENFWRANLLKLCNHPCVNRKNDCYTSTGYYILICILVFHWYISMCTAYPHWENLFSPFLVMVFSCLISSINLWTEKNNNQLVFPFLYLFLFFSFVTFALCTDYILYVSLCFSLIHWLCHF